MKKYKSMLFREWKISRRQYIVRLVFMLLFAVMFGISIMVVKDLGTSASEDGAGMAFFAILASGLLATLAAILAVEDTGVFKSDVNSNWLSYSYALPITAFEQATSRYIMKLIVIIAGSGITILSAVGICSAAGSQLSSAITLSVFLFVGVVDVMLIYDIIQQTIVMRARDSKKVKKVSAIASTVAFLVLMVLPELLPDDKLDSLDFFTESPAELIIMIESVINKSGIPSVVILIVLLVIGFTTTWKSFERREG